MSSTNNLFYSFCVSPDEWIIFDPDRRCCEYECWGDDDSDIFDDQDDYCNINKDKDKDEPKSGLGENEHCGKNLDCIRRTMPSCLNFDPSVFPPPLNNGYINHDKNNNGGDDDDDDFALFHIPGDNVDAKGDVKNCLEEYYRFRYEYTLTRTRCYRKVVKKQFKREMAEINKRCHSYNERIHDQVMLDRQRLKRIEPPEISLYYWSVYTNYRPKDIHHVNSHIHPAYEVFSNWYFGDKGFNWTDLGTTVKSDIWRHHGSSTGRFALNQIRCPYDNSDRVFTVCPNTLLQR